MGRHNREGTGEDQRGFEYDILYPPDWLRCLKVARLLPSGRRSTMILFRNPAEHREDLPGNRVRTRIACARQGVDVEVAVRADHERLSSVRVVCDVPRVDGEGVEEVIFILEGGLPPAPAPAAIRARR